MEKKISQISINGIIRNLVDANSPDNACQEIINLRLKDGNWQNAGNKVAAYGPVTAGINYTEIYKHPVLNDNQFIGLGSDNKIYYFTISGATISETEILDLTTETFYNFSHMGTILIVSSTTNKHYLKYDIDIDQYDELELPIIPFFEIYADDESSSNITGTDFEDARTALLALVDSREQSGYVNGAFIMRVAYELYDGNILFYSQLFTVPTSDQGLSYNSGTYTYSGIKFKTPKFKYAYTNDQFSILQQWEGLIFSLNIYLSPLVNTYKWSAELDEYSGGSPPLNSGLTSIIEDIQNFYLVKKYTYNDLIDEQVMTSWEYFDNLYNIEVYESLPVDQLSNHKIIASDNFEFNNRLHLGNVKTIFGNGYNLFQYNNSFQTMSKAPDTFYMEVYLKTDKTQIVSHEIIAYIYTSAGTDFYLLNRIISYPDKRAYQIKLIAYHSGIYYLIKTFDLIPHNTLNFAYHRPVDSVTSQYYLNVYPNWTETQVSLATEDNVYENTNRVQVSYLDNPFYYPTEYSYRIGAGETEILRIVTQSTEPLSEGQFGEFPVIVFTDRGIWALQQGTGNILYAAITPININEICNNADSVLNIGGMVTYATNEGFKILKGRNSQEISQLIEGEIKNHIYENSFYAQNLSNTKVANIYDYISTINFLDFIANCKVGYDYVNKEIILSYINDSSVSTPSWIQYSYVFSLLNQTWTKRSESFTQFINVFPNFYGLKDDTLYDLSDEDTSSYPTVLLQTRPIKFGTFSPKKILKAIFRGHFEVKTRTYAGVYIFASNNRENYHFVSGKEIKPDEFYDITLMKVRMSARYFIIVLVGQFTDTQLAGIECEIGERFQNKLR